MGELSENVKAIDVVKQMVADGQISQDVAENYFPELKKSEDMIMVKFIKNQLFNIKKTITENYELDAKLTKAIDWLEKQCNLMKALQISNAKIGELIEKNYYLKEQLEKQGKNSMGISEATKQKLEDNLHKALEKETPESCNEFLDEQCEQKPVIKMKTPEESLGIDSETYSKIVDECIYGEQKSIKEHNACEFCEDRYGCVSPCHMKLVEEEKFTNKVEPKFKIEEGKWYVCTQTYVLRGKIVVIKGQTYQAEKDNVIKGEDGCLFIDRHDGKASDYFRSWTIQDAKDGDVLFTSSTASHETFIFKNIDERGNVECYFAYDSEDGFREGKYHFIGSAINCKPATKEQYDTLMKVMTDRGYTFDSKKKELKKIEQKPLQWNISDYRTWQYIVADVLTKHDGIGQYLDNGFCKKIAKYMQEEWSKKLCLIQHTDCSEEDEDTIKFLISHFCVSHCNRSFQFTDNKLITHDELLEKIRNLRPHWKPSNDQMDALDYYANSICTYSDRQDDLRSLFNDLKKLITK